jgi:hypothetical protein
MKHRKLTAAELVAELATRPESRAKIQERQAMLAGIHERRRQDEAALVEELRLAGLEVSSVYDLVNTASPYPDAIPILIRHLELPHEKIIREGIIRALTIKNAGNEVETALLHHFEKESESEVRWVIANALKMAMPLSRRKLRPEIEKVFRK